ncbi:MAG: ABC transporter substrate-binding protein [Geminicoccaceae bacterium]
MTSAIRIRSGRVLGGAAVAMCLALGSGPVQAQKMHEGVEVNLLTRPGPVIAGRLEERGKDFEAMTGAKINVSSVPFADLFQKLLTDWATGTNSIDVGVFASGWAVEMVDGGLLADLSEFVANDPELMVDDIAPYFREFNQKIDGKTYLITIDGDFQMVYYRKDVLDELGLEPPKTWGEYLEVAAAANGKDMNGDGEADFGSCMFKKRNAQSFYAIMSIAAPYVQTQGTGQGIFFDTEDMTPLVNNEAWAEALAIYKETGKYGPPEEMNHDIGDTRALVTSGRCALVIDWGDIGPLSIDPETSKVQDLLGAVILPGSTRVLDWETGELVDCSPELCPYAIDGVNHAPFAAFGGWSGAINAASEPQVVEAAYDFLSYMNEPEQSNVDVTIGWTGYNPYRISQVENLEPWVKAGFSQEFAQNYLGAIGDSLNSPNMTSDLRIPGTQRYEGVVLDRELARFLAGEVTAEEALQNVHDGWEEITEEFGRDEQLQLYKASLGITN